MQYKGNPTLSDLPEFQKRAIHKVQPLVHQIFGSNLIRLDTFDDGHFRVVFRPSHFVLQGDATEPSKSQWSTLKKQLKRRDHQIFVFKEYGTVPCNAETDATCLYLDFGFFLDMM